MCFLFSYTCNIPFSLNLVLPFFVAIFICIVTLSLLLVFYNELAGVDREGGYVTDVWALYYRCTPLHCVRQDEHNFFTADCSFPGSAASHATTSKAVIDFFKSNGLYSLL